MEKNEEEENLTMVISENIVRFRRRIKISQIELGKMVGLGRGAIIRMESGESNYEYFYLRRVANALGIDIETLTIP